MTALATCRARLQAMIDVQTSRPSREELQSLLDSAARLEAALRRLLDAYTCRPPHTIDERTKAGAMARTALTGHCHDNAETLP